MSDPLVSAQWLAVHSRDGLCVLDIRSAVAGSGAAAYEAAHVPGAVHTDYVKDGWRATKGMATGLLPAVLGVVGVNGARHVRGFIGSGAAAIDG